MENLAVILVLAAILGLAGFYILRAKKKGQKCIGCPAGGCAGCSCSCKRPE